MREKLFFYLSLIALFLWVGLIFWFSSRSSVTSADQSGGIVALLSKSLVYITSGKFVPNSKYLSELDHIIRKSAHMFLYFVLGFLTLNLIGYCQKIRQKVIFSLIFCILYSMSDELHQYYVPGRASLNKDIIIDSIGSAAGVFFHKLVIIIRKRHKLNNNNNKNIF